MVRKLALQLIPSLHIHVGHQIQLQDSGVQQKLVQRPQRRAHHALLHRRDAVGGIEFLSLSVSFQKCLRRRHWRFLDILKERILLHISGRFPVLHRDQSALRRFGMAVHPQRF